MSRRPQVLRVTDSANSVLVPRRPSPASPPPAIVATFTTAPPAVAAAAAEKPALEDSHFRAVSYSKEAVPSTLSLDRRARFSRHRSVPGRLDEQAGGGEVAAAFDGLVQYLQSNRSDLRGLLLNSDVVIVEPVRSCRIAGATVKGAAQQQTPDSGSMPNRSLTIPRSHHFYHPRRQNRELVDEELPDPDTVRRARQLFEATLEMRSPDRKVVAAPAPVKTAAVVRRPGAAAEDGGGKRWTDSASVSSGVASDLSSVYDNHSTPASDSDHEDDEVDDGRGGSPAGDARVSREVLEKIRACGTSVTYYGGRVIARSPPGSPVNAVMDEIGRSESFRLVKSNSCGSRLELAGGHTPRTNGKSVNASSRELFRSTLEDVSLRQATELKKKTPRPVSDHDAIRRSYCCNGVGGKAINPRGFGDMEFEEFEVLEEGGKQGAESAETTAST